MLIWECNHRIELLRHFRELVIHYFNNVTYRHFGISSENEEAQRARREMNRLWLEARQAIQAAGVSTSMYYAPPPAVGGLAGNVDLLANLYNLQRFQIPPQHVVDAIEQALGVYEHERPKALLRTLNPFYRLGRALALVVSIPFRLIGLAGFDAKKAEDSWAGKLVKLMLGLLTTLATILTILDFLGWLDAVKIAIQNLFQKRYTARSRPDVRFESPRLCREGQ